MKLQTRWKNDHDLCECELGREKYAGTGERKRENERESEAGGKCCEYMNVAKQIHVTRYSHMH